jgi:hypothetical protein
MRARRGTIAASTGNSVAAAIVDTTKPVQTSAACSGSIHPAASAARLAGADSERRRLSSIFQRPSAGSPGPKIHGKSCQSPRVQRCWRAAATS